MSYFQRSLHRRVFRTSHKILLDRLLFPVLRKISGHVLVLGAGKEPYKKLLPRAAPVILTDVEPLHENLDLVVDAHSIPFPDSSFDCVLAVEVFEHLQNPCRAASEIYRVLCANGLAILSVPFMFHVHGDPFDFQRFTDRGLESIFESFSDICIIPFGSRLHVISDIITTAAKIFAVFRIANWFLTLPPFCSASQDCPSGYILILRK